MFLTAHEMYELEEKVFESGVEPETLMNQAGLGVAREIFRRYHGCAPGEAIAVIGNGNNGADALVALRHLKEAGWEIAVRSAADPNALEGLAAKKLRELGEVSFLTRLQASARPGPLVLLDGLLGIGTSGDLREPIAGLAREINDLSERRSAFVVAVDVPSGLNCDSGACGANAVRADLTCTLGSPKRGLVADPAINHVGSLALLKVQGLSDWDLGQDHLITPDTLPVDQLARSYDFHKGQAGRVGIVAGSRGLAGAAALTSLGALHGGGGLITLFVKESDYPLLLPLAPVEVMVRPIENVREILDHQLDSLALGPGLGSEASPELLRLIDDFDHPMVVDADALNLIAREGSLAKLEPRHLVTPHPGEMARLLPIPPGELTRAETAREFTRRSAATLLFKGARTIVTAPQAPLRYNTTGTPGMATGGQGDVLTGLLAALLARGLPPLEAAAMGAWLSGRASEIALARESIESLSATVTAGHLGPAFHDLRAARS